MTFTFVPRRNQAKFKPKFSENKIREAVVCALRLKIEKPRTYLILTIKEFYKNNYPEEYDFLEL